ncbi:hypothetical protein [Herbaspirillum sp. B65]|uniref:hypothetical protein n=1 Tax=Herbaspirillum sp. B65 TaxID=137708 RepID=UPI000345DCDA|nr:hypothetical protein [Herbaspirillum sp. B65]
MDSEEEKSGPARETPTERVSRLLRELIGLTGQPDATVATLELQLGEIFTRTLIDPETPDRHLAITALLPRCEQPHYLPRMFSPPGAPPLPPQTDFLWHADQGCYIVVQRIAVAELPDERSIMDAILVTADIARDYHLAINASAASAG